MIIAILAAVTIIVIALIAGAARIKLALKHLYEEK